MHEFRLTPSELSDIYERLGLGLPTFHSANSPLVLNPNFDEEPQPGSAVYDANTGRPSKAGKQRADGELAEDSAVKRGKTALYLLPSGTPIRTPKQKQAKVDN